MLGVQFDANEFKHMKVEHKESKFPKFFATVTVIVGILTVILFGTAIVLKNNVFKIWEDMPSSLFWIIPVTGGGIIALLWIIGVPINSQISNHRQMKEWEREKARKKDKYFR